MDTLRETLSKATRKMFSHEVPQENVDKMVLAATLAYTPDQLFFVAAELLKLTDEQLKICCAGLSSDGLIWTYGDGSGPVVVISQLTSDVLAYMFNSY